jgi:hypothetical protein
LAQILRLSWNRSVHVKSYDAHRLRAALGARMQLIGMATELSNHVRGVLKVFGIVVEHVADLHLAVGDDHAVDQQLNQRPSLLECRVGQALPHPLAEVGILHGPEVRAHLPQPRPGSRDVARHRCGTRWYNHASHDLAKLAFDLSVRFPREQFRPGYGRGFLGAPVIVCSRSGESRSGCGGADDPAQRGGAEPDGSGEP